jgi:hypothetical protein
MKFTKLSQRLLNGDFQAGFIILTDMYHYAGDINNINVSGMLTDTTVTKLSDEIIKLEDENAELKARLKGISQRAEDIQQAVVDMEEVLLKFRLPG